VADVTLRRSPRPRPADAARRRRATTPGRLRTLSALAVALAVAAAVLGAGALATAAGTALGVQQRTAPAVVGMQRIHAWLADADRSAANAYLAGGSEVTLPELQYQADIAAASRELQAASEHNPEGDDGSRRLQSIVTLVDQYIGLVQSATVQDRLGVPVGTVYLEAATALMHQPGEGILAQVDALRDLYAAGLDRANRVLQVAAGVLGAALATAAALLVTLVVAQRFLRRRFHRRRNPRLIAATLLLVVVAAATAGAAARAGQAVHAAEHQRYARVLALWQARALLADANGNESLSLIGAGTPAGTAADQAFQRETRRLVDRPLTDELLRDASAGRVGFEGLLADELRAADTAAERSGTLRVLRLYRTFLDVDAAVRARAAQGDRAGAILLALGTDQGQLIFAFADVDWHLGLVVQDLQDQFDTTMRLAELGLAAAAAGSLVTLAVAALALTGVRPRLAEYRAGGPRQP
jgi:hypothetical protein